MSYWKMSDGSFVASWVQPLFTEVAILTGHYRSLPDERPLDQRIVY